MLSHTQWQILVRGSWNDPQRNTTLQLVSSHRSGGTLAHVIHHRSPKVVDIFHWFLRWRAVLPLLFSITNSERRNVLNFIWFFTSKMGHWLLHSAHVPPSSQLFILIHQKQHHSHRFKNVTNISEVGWIGCVLVIFLTSSIVKNLMDGHTLSCRGALSFQSVWSITQASIDQSLTLKNS